MGEFAQLLGKVFRSKTAPYGGGRIRYEKVSKSPGPCVHVGSIPSDRTSHISGFCFLRVHALGYRFGVGVQEVFTQNRADGFDSILLTALR